MKWTTSTKMSSISGYSENAIRAKIKRGVWLMGKHWRKAPDNRILLCPKEIDAWVENN